MWYNWPKMFASGSSEITRRLQAECLETADSISFSCLFFQNKPSFFFVKFNMTRCAASSLGCQSGKPGTATVQMVCFPKNVEVCATWLENLGRGADWQPSKSSALCILHFENSQFEEGETSRGKKVLIPNAIPTIFGSQGKKLPVWNWASSLLFLLWSLSRWICFWTLRIFDLL